MAPMQVLDEGIIQRILNDLAAERGISREDLEAEIEQLRSDTSGDVHLTFEEALETGALRPERQAHWESCLHCRELVRTLTPSPSEVGLFVAQVRRPNWIKRAAVAAFAVLSLAVLFKPLLRATGSGSGDVPDPEPVTASKS